MATDRDTAQRPLSCVVRLHRRPSSRKRTRPAQRLRLYEIALAPSFLVENSARSSRNHASNESDEWPALLLAHAPALVPGSPLMSRSIANS